MTVRDGHLARRVAAQGLVGVDDLEREEELALVLVQALDLRVEHAGRVEVDVQELLHPLGQEALVGELHRAPLRPELRVLGEGLDRAQLVEVPDPAAPDPARDQVGQPPVRLVQPPPRGDAVRLVVDARREHAVDVGQEPALEELGVERGHAVDGEAPHAGQVGHAHLPVEAGVDDRHARHARLVTRELAPDLPRASAGRSRR
jgi:hypothetical protein